MDATPATCGTRISPDVIAPFVLACFGLPVSEFRQELVSFSESVVWQFVAANQAWFIKLSDWMFRGYTSVATLAPEDYAAFQPMLIHRLLDELTYLWDLSAVTARCLPWTEIARRHRLAQYLLRTM